MVVWYNTVSNRTTKIIEGEKMGYSDLPEEVKKYFESGRRKITNFIANDDYSLTITFDNGEVKIYSMVNQLIGVFEILKNKEKFKEAFIDEAGNLAWDKDKLIDSRINWSNRIVICVDAVYLNSF
jgi:hypothetical protein